LIALFSFSSPIHAGHKSKKHKADKEKKLENKKVEENHTLQISDLSHFLKEVPPPQWMLDQIHADLAPLYELGISSSAMDQMIDQDMSKASPLLLARYKIQNNKVEVSALHFPPRVDDVTNAIKKLAQAIELPDMDFIVTMHDAFDGCETLTPIFAFAKDPKYAPMVILIPDFEALSGREQLIRKVQESNEKYPWIKKTNKAVWRGSRTGGGFTLDNFLQFPRTRAVTCSLLNPNLLNARFSIQASDKGEQERIFPQYFGKALPVEDHIQFKYQLLIDGNSCAYSGAFWRLFSNCVTLKQNSDSIQWYYGAIHPNIHFLPVNADLSNLPEVIEWAMKHDAEALQISKQAQAFANGNLTDLRIMQYLYYLLVEYAKLPLNP
jgi:hypothetical protein